MARQVASVVQVRASVAMYLINRFEQALTGKKPSVALGELQTLRVRPVLLWSMASPTEAKEFLESAERVAQQPVW